MLEFYLCHTLIFKAFQCTEILEDYFFNFVPGGGGPNSLDAPTSLGALSAGPTSLGEVF